MACLIGRAGKNSLISQNKNPGYKPGSYSCALAGIQTPNLLIRSQMLYSIELRVRFRNRTANVKIKITDPKSDFCAASLKAYF
jgi:hypothetical protein